LALTLAFDSRTLPLDSMVRKLLAVGLVALIVLPFTAPFATCDGPGGGPHATIISAGVGVLTTQADQTNDDALVAAECLDSSQQSRLCVGVAVGPPTDVASNRSRLPSGASRLLVLHTPRISILRI
jgi:hypothetical protein